MDSPTSILTEPITQYGMAGMCAVLVAIIIWLIQKLLDALKETNAVISSLTEVLRASAKTADDTLKLQIQLKDQLLSRPCMLPPR
jgi:hypothetical protein